MYIGISSECEDDDEDSAPLMILEYMPYGDLQSFLENHKYVNTINLDNCAGHYIDKCKSLVPIILVRGCPYIAHGMTLYYTAMFACVNGIIYLICFRPDEHGQTCIGEKQFHTFACDVSALMWLHSGYLFPFKFTLIYTDCTGTRLSC